MKEKILTVLKDHWNSLLKEGQALTFHEGQVLFYESHTPYGLFVVQSGKVQFGKSKHPCQGEHIWTSPHGKVLGVRPLFEGNSYCCTCTASKDCKTIFISKTQLLPYLPHDLIWCT